MRHRAAPDDVDVVSPFDPLSGELASGSLLGSRTIVFPRLGSAPSHPIAAQTLDGHVAQLVGGTRCSGAALLDLLDELAITGHGGGHFPVAAKWRASLSAGGDGLVVANGCEGEPGSAKDAALLQLRPHLVLDGLADAARAVRARICVILLKDGATATRVAVSRAVAERQAAGWDEPPVRFAFGPDRYLTGESSAVVRALAGGPALPAFTRIPSARSGVRGRPTLVHNVETLARIALAAAGRPAISTLLTVVRLQSRTVVEVPPWTPLRAVVEDVTSRGDGSRWQGVLVGGYGGRWLDRASTGAAQANDRSLRSVGGTLGAGVIAPLPVGACPIAEIAALARYLADSSARQCGPCVFGLADVAELLSDIARCRSHRGHETRLRRFLGEVDGRGACHHPDGAVAMIESGLRVFEDDLRGHLESHRCVSGGPGDVLPIPSRA